MEESIYGYLVFYIVFSALTGSIMFAVWMAVEKALRRYLSAHVSVVALEICLICFLVPVIYIRNIYWRFQLGFDAGNMFFEFSPAVISVLRVFFIVWIAGFVFSAAVYIYSKVMFERNIELSCHGETDVRVRNILEEYRKRLGIRNEIRVSRSADTKIAFVCGVFRPHLVLPADRFFEERELRVVLLHELIHVRRHDILVKHIGVLIRCLYWFHPLAHLIIRKLAAYIEFRCDELCCGAKYGGELGTKEYFGVIIHSRIVKKRSVFFVYAGFAETMNDLKRRINYMKEKKKTSGIRRLCVVMAVVLAVNGGLVTAYAASDSALDKYTDLNDVVSDKGNLDMDESGDFKENFVVIEESAEEDDPNVTEIDITDEIKTRSTTFNVTLAPRYRKTVSLFMVKGDQLKVSAIVVPSTITARVGIIRPNNSKGYVEGKGVLNGSFTAATSDTHKLYIENMDKDKPITVAVSYSVVTP